VSCNCYSALVGVRSIAIDPSVYVPVCREHISGTAGPISTKFCVQLPCGHGSVLLRRCCAELCTSGFMDDVTFGCNGRDAGKGWQHSRVSDQLRARPGRSLMSMNACYYCVLLYTALFLYVGLLWPHVSGTTLFEAFYPHYGELSYVYMFLLLMWIDEINKRTFGKTYTSLFVVYLRSNSASGAIHFTGRRPCIHTNVMHQLKEIDRYCQWRSQQFSFGRGAKAQEFWETKSPNGVQGFAPVGDL